MRRMIDLGYSLEEKLGKLMKGGKITDFESFAIAAIENQIIFENSKKNLIEFGKSDQISQTQGPPINWRTLTMVPSEEVKIMEPPNETDLTGSILWGQYYRFLPAKFGVRVLANITKNNFLKVDDFKEQAVKAAVSFTRHLIKLDKKEKNEFGEQLSAGFPANTQKSMLRFATQTLIYVRRISSRIDGLLPALKFVNITEDDNDDFTNIGLTEFGKEFAKIKNPILDEEGSVPFSFDEKQFLIDHILKNLPNEAQHIAYGLELIKSGTDSRSELNKQMRKFYQKHHPNYVNWSDAAVNTMRAGLLGRIYELKLISKDKQRKNVKYSITEDGNKFIEMVPDFKQIL